MLLWVPEGTDAQYLSDLPDTIEVGYLPQNDQILPPDAGRVEFLIAPWVRNPTLFAAQIRQLTSLKVIQSYSAGIDRLTEFIPAGVKFCNGRGLHDSAVSEWVIGAILASYNKFTDYVKRQDKGQWSSIETDTLEGDTVTIFGYGSIGKAVEKRLTGFGVNVQRIARSGRIEGDGTQIHSFKYADDVISSTNVLVVLVPLTTETQGIIGRRALQLLPDGALVVAAGRGKTVDTDALIAELTAGRLRAVLDTTDPEPIPAGHPLWTTPNLLLTQHSSGNSTDYLDKVYPFIYDQLRRYMAGEPLLNVISGEY